MVMIVWQVDLQLPVQSVHITSNVVISNPANGEVYSIQHYVIKFVTVTCNSLVVFSGFPPPIKLAVTILLKYCWKWC